MQKSAVPPIVTVLGDKSLVGKSLLAPAVFELRATDPSAGRDGGPIMSGPKRTSALSGPPCHTTKRRRD